MPLNGSSSRSGGVRNTEPSSSRRRTLAKGFASSLLILLLIVAGGRAAGMNEASAGFLILFSVLLIASRYPLLVSSSSAVIATLLYNFFFFPPTGTFTVEDPDNWIALATFLATSLLANRMLVREKLQAENAEARRRELEALYGLSIDLLQSGEGLEGAGAAAAAFVRKIGARAGGLIVFGSSAQQQRVLSWSGDPPSDEVEEIAAGVGRHGRSTDIPSRFGRDHCLPIVIDGRTRAALLGRGASLSISALESAASILSFALERELFADERARLTALRQSDELKSSLLQAVSHDLKSPLTVLSVEAEALEQKGGDPAVEPHVRVIREEVMHLQRRIDNLLALARIESGIIAPRPEPTPPADLLRAARESLPTVVDVRPVTTYVESDMPDVFVDPSLALEILVNLIENAHRASPEKEALELAAQRSAEMNGRVWLEVLDRGSGIPAETGRSLRAAGERGTSVGLGIELVRTLASLCGGSVEWFDRPGGGTLARVDLPAANVPDTTEVSK